MPFKFKHFRSWDFLVLTCDENVQLRSCFKHLALKTGVEQDQNSKHFFSTLHEIDVNAHLHIPVALTPGSALGTNSIGGPNFIRSRLISPKIKNNEKQSVCPLYVLTQVSLLGELMTGFLRFLNPYRHISWYNNKIGDALFLSHAFEFIH